MYEGACMCNVCGKISSLDLNLFFAQLDGGDFGRSNLKCEEQVLQQNKAHSQFQICKGEELRKTFYNGK